MSIVRIFGIPMDLGQSRRGVDMGPSALRYAELQERLRTLGYSPVDHGNITVPQAEEDLTEAIHIEGTAHFLPQVARVCQQVYHQITTCLHPEEYGVFMGGDHSLSIGTVSAVTSVFRGQRVGVLWVDAHADMNTPHTTPSGNIHGMALAVLLGQGPRVLTELGYPDRKLWAQHVGMVGVRDVDAEEALTVRASGVHVFTMRDIDEKGMKAVADDLLALFADVDTIHVSLDLDSCDPSFAPGVGTPVLGGLSYREAHLLMEILADSGKVRTVDIVEINPILDERNRTAEIAVELIASLFGERIM